MIQNIDWKAVGIASVVFIIFFKLANIMPTEFNIVNIALIIGVSTILVFLSRIFVKVDRMELIPTSVAVILLIMLFVKFIGPEAIGIMGPPKMSVIPGMQGILGFLVIDVLGIPSYALWIAFGAAILFMFIRPMIGFGLILLLIACILFVATPLMFWDDLIAAGTGILMILMGIMPKRGARRAMPYGAPVMIYNIDAPGPAIGSGSRDRSWFWGKK